VAIFFAGPVWSYEVTWEELPTLGGGYTFVTCVNDIGQMAGISDSSNFLWHADTGMIDLGTLDGTPFDIGAMNNSGMINGRIEPPEVPSRLVLWQEGVGYTDLGNLGGSFIVPGCLNDAGQMVGYGETATGEIHAYTWQADTGMIDLGTFGGLESGAGGINKSGQILGSYVTASGEGHSFVWKKGKLTDLGIATDKAIAIGAGDMNDTGRIAGTSQDYFHAILWKNGKTTDLGTLGGAFSVGLYINEAEQVVGYSETAEEGIVHPFLWPAKKKIDGTQTMIDLGSAGGYSYLFPTALNNMGQVAGNATTVSGVDTAFFWQEDLGMIDLDLEAPPLGPVLMNEYGQVVVNVNFDGILRTFIFTIIP